MSDLDSGAILGGPRQGAWGLGALPCLGQAKSQRRESREAVALLKACRRRRGLNSDPRERFKRGPEGFRGVWGVPPLELTRLGVSRGEPYERSNSSVRVVHLSTENAVSTTGIFKIYRLTTGGSRKCR